MTDAQLELGCDLARGLCLCSCADKAQDFPPGKGLGVNPPWMVHASVCGVPWATQWEPAGAPSSTCCPQLLHPSFCSWLWEVSSAPQEPLLLCLTPVICVFSKVAGSIWHLVDPGPLVPLSAVGSPLDLKSAKMDFDFFLIYQETC